MNEEEFCLPCTELLFIFPALYRLYIIIYIYAVIRCHVMTADVFELIYFVCTGKHSGLKCLKLPG